MTHRQGRTSVLLLTAMILFCASGCYVRFVRPFEGHVTNVGTKVGIPGVLIQARYMGVGLGFPEAKTIIYGTYYAATDEVGRYAFPSQWFVVALTSYIDDVNVRAIHPLYGTTTGEQNQSVEHLDTLDFALTPLEDYCIHPARPGYFVDGEMRCGLYFRHATDLKLPVALDNALDYWRGLQRKYPEKADRIKSGVAALGMTGIKTSHVAGRVIATFDSGIGDARRTCQRTTAG